MKRCSRQIIIEETTRVFQGEVTAIDKLAGDASDRSFYRIRLNGKPESAVLMELAQPDPASELPYIKVGRFFRKIGLPAPEIYHYNKERGLLFLEDVGEKSLYDEIEENGLNPLHYQQALDLILILQEEGSRKCGKRYLTAAFDEEKFLWELDFFLIHTVKRYQKLPLSETGHRAFTAEFRRLIKPLLARPQVLTHRDYHSRNLLIRHNRLTVIDFQDARWGPCEYDIASLLRDSYVKLDEMQVSQLIQYFLEKRRRNYGCEMESETFRRMFDWMSVQRNLKAIGTFTSQFNLRNNDFYLRFISDTAAYVRANCRKYPELDRLGDLLAHYKVIKP